MNANGITRRQMLAGAGAAAIAAIGGAIICGSGVGVALAEDHKNTATLTIYKHMKSKSTPLDNAYTSDVPLAGVAFGIRRVYTADEIADMKANDATLSDASFTSDPQTYSNTTVDLATIGQIDAGDNTVNPTEPAGTDQSGATTSSLPGAYADRKWKAGEAWKTATTGTDGIATFTIGINDYGTYVVVEDTNTAAQAGSVDEVEPFVITLPYVDKTGQVQYTVRAEPKNHKLTMSKHIVNGYGYPEDSKTGAPTATGTSDVKLMDNKLGYIRSVHKGDDVYFELEGDVPANLGSLYDASATGAQQGRYILNDVINNAFTYKEFVSATYRGIDIKASVTPTTTGVIPYDGSKDTKGFSFSVAPKALYDIDQAAATNGATDDRRVIVRYSATLNGETAGDAETKADCGIYPNKAQLEVTNRAGVAMAPVQSNTVRVYNGEIEVTKTNEGGTILPGAEFAIANSLDNARANSAKYLNDTNVTKSVEATNHDMADGFWDGTDTVTTGADGKCKFTGLYVPEDGTPIDYYLYETKAPQGYAVVGEPIKVTLQVTTSQDAESKQVSITSDGLTASADVKVTVKDSEDGFLPGTGGIKNAAPIAAGIGAAAVIGAGAVVYGKTRAGSKLFNKMKLYAPKNAY